MLDSKKPLKELTREYILNYIRDQHLMPGDKLPAQREWSRILNVSPKIPEIVLNEMEAEHLVIRRSGRGTFLAGKEETLEQKSNPNRNIFLLLPNLRNQHFAEYAANGEIALVRHKKTLQLITAEAMPHARDIIAKMILEGTSGIIAYYCPPGLRDFAHRHNVPLVEFRTKGNTGRPPARGKYVCTNMQAASLMLGKHLLELGHRDIYLAGDIPHEKGQDYRFEVLTHFLRENGCTVRYMPQKHPVPDYPGYEAIGVELAQRMMEEGLPATAGVFFNSNRAVGAMRYLMQKGVRIPEDFSIVGFDRMFNNGFPEPEITAAMFEHEIEIAINLVLSEKQSVKSVTIDPVLFAGSTTAPARTWRINL